MSLSLCKSKHESRTTSPLTSLNMHRPKYGGRRNKITGTGGLVWSNLGIWPKTMSWAKICGWCLGIGTKNIFSFLAVVVASKLEWNLLAIGLRGSGTRCPSYLMASKLTPPNLRRHTKWSMLENWHHLMF